jgi:hypothetical protein
MEAVVNCLLKDQEFKVNFIEKCLKWITASSLTLGQ